MQFFLLWPSPYNTYCGLRPYNCTTAVAYVLAFFFAVTSVATIYGCGPRPCNFPALVFVVVNFLSEVFCPCSFFAAAAFALLATQFTVTSVLAFYLLWPVFLQLSFAAVYVLAISRAVVFAPATSFAAVSVLRYVLLWPGPCNIFCCDLRPCNFLLFP